MTRLPPRVRVGDRVYVQGMPVMSLEVIDCSDPSMITLRAHTGATLRVGRNTVIPATQRAAQF
jgi:hypothetical protein